MKELLKVLLLVAVLSVMLSMDWVAYSQEQECPSMEKEERALSQGEFLQAHGLSQENYSIWLMEHSAWRQQFSVELQDYSFIPDRFNSGDVY